MVEKANDLPIIGKVKELTSRKFSVHQGKKPGAVKRAGFDFSFVFSLSIILIFGLIMVYSATQDRSLAKTGSGFTMLRTQIIATALGILVFWIISVLDYRRVINNKFVLAALYLGSAVAMFSLLALGNGGEDHGAARWIDIGPVNFQPVELFKIASIAVTAVFIAKQPGRFDVKYKGDVINYLRHSRSVHLILLCGVIPAIMSVIISNNLSSAIILFMIPTLMTFMVNRNKKGYYILFALIGVVVVIAMIYGKTATPGDNFRLKRLCAWMRPEEFAGDEALQTIQSKYAIGSGGVFGKGLGKSLQKLGKLPEAHNDMIFAVICEELGIFGGIMTVAMFGLLLWRIRVIAKSAPDRLGMLLCMGVFFHVAIQVFVNIGVATGVIVNTGVTLPFISYGGTSMFFLLAEMGIVMSVAKRRMVKG